MRRGRGVRRLGLHAKGEFVAGDAGVQLGLLLASEGVLAIQLIEEVQLAALLCVADAFGGI